MYKDLSNVTDNVVEIHHQCKVGQVVASARRESYIGPDHLAPSTVPETLHPVIITK